MAEPFSQPCGVSRATPKSISLVASVERQVPAWMLACRLRSGVTESEIAAAVHAGCIAAGAERMDFGCFPIAGERSFMKNVWPRPDKQVRDNQLVVIDIGAQMAGYQSDMSRNGVAGEPSPEIRRLLDACLEAEEAGLEQARPGETIDSVLKTMNSVILEHGFCRVGLVDGARVRA
jgi:Xaa-Pro aminopeptidase